MRAQEALRVVVFLMSHGADARAVNHLGETPLDLASRLTSGFPKSRSLLVSILDSSKYQITGGAVFIVPGKPQLERVYEGNDDETPDPGTSTVTARGVTFSPSQRNRRAKKAEDIANSQRPYTSVSVGPPFDKGRSQRVPALPRGDHETALGGSCHRLAAKLGSRRYRDRSNYRCDPSRDNAVSGKHSKHTSSVGGLVGEHPRRDVGVVFKNFRMGRSSAVLVSESKRRRARNDTALRPTSCPVNVERREARRGASSLAGRPATSNRTVEKSTNSQTDVGCNKTIWKQAGARDLNRKRRGQQQTATSGREKARAFSVPDSEARRQIVEWLRESAGTASAVPPATAHGAGEYLVETSSYVATSRRRDVYKALQAIKGGGRGELVSASKLRGTLCRVGQPLSTNEMDELLREVDPGETGCVSFSRILFLRTKIDFFFYILGLPHGNQSHTASNASKLTLAVLLPLCAVLQTLFSVLTLPQCRSAYLWCSKHGVHLHVLARVARWQCIWMVDIVVCISTVVTQLFAALHYRQLSPSACDSNSLSMRRTRYVSCSRLANLVAGERLVPLAKGKSLSIAVSDRLHSAIFYS